VSLVRDALAKAQRESAARAAREGGLPAELSALPQPYRARRRRRWPWAVGLAAAALAGAAAALLLLPARRNSVSGSQVPAGAAGAGVAVAPISEGAPGKGEGARASAPAAAAAAAMPSESTSESAASPASGSTIGTDEASPAPAVDRERRGIAIDSNEATVESSPPLATASARDRAGAPPPATPAPSVPASAAAAPSGAHVLEVALGGGRAIQLGGIAWSEATPLAYLNGRLVGVGEYVEGFRVVSIERDRVRFDGGDEATIRFEIRLR
jgi:hypothetical protein